MEDRELVRRCLAGETTAWEAFVGRYHPLLAREIAFALRRCGIPDDAALADDLLQAVFQALLENDRAALRRFRWDSSLETYLKLVAFRRAMNGLRRRALTGAAEQALFDKARERLSAETDALPENTLPVRDEMERALGCLPDRERLALQLHYWDGIPADRLAALLSVRKDSLRTLLSRARGRLRLLLRAPLCL